MKFPALLLAILLAVLARPAAAESARDILMSAAFTATDKATALASIDRAIKSADAALARNPADWDAQLQHAMAISYRGKLKRSRSDIVASRKAFEAVVAAEPRNPEAQMALAGWHLGAVIELGPFLARTMLGASKAAGLKAMDRSVALGGGRAFFPAVACLHRIQVDPNDVATSLRLAEAAAAASADTPADRMMQKFAAVLIPPLRKGDGAAAAQAAKILMPFGRIR